MKTYLAIVEGRSGYVLDVYPEEIAKNKRSLGDTVIGEYVSAADATQAVVEALKQRGVELDHD